MAKDQLWKGGRITNHLSRLRHFRGHGIHSPFIYSIMRNVFMKRRLQCENVALFEQLQAIASNTQSAYEIANLATHCNLNNFSIDSSAGKELIICSADCHPQRIVSLCHDAATNGITFVILHPYKHRKLCDQLLKENRSTSLDRFGYIVLFNNNLPKQHYKL
ncbi:MAG: hypothetical protein SNH94_04055 [Rikenellaceae bacterium]